jgi:hypothetical protein
MAEKSYDDVVQQLIALKADLVEKKKKKDLDEEIHANLDFDNEERYKHLFKTVCTPNPDNTLAADIETEMAVAELKIKAAKVESDISWRSYKLAYENYYKLKNTVPFEVYNDPDDDDENIPMFEASDFSINGIPIANVVGFCNNPRTIEKLYKVVDPAILDQILKEEQEKANQ